MTIRGICLFLAVLAFGGGSTVAADTIGTTYSEMPLQGSWPGFSGTGMSECPAGSFVTGIQGFKSDGRRAHTVDDPISELRYLCGAADGRTTLIGKTFAGIPDSGSFEGFSGTGMVACPIGMFVSAIQGFKSDTLGPHVVQHPISELRYTCADGRGRTSIGKTYGDLPDKGSFPGFSGTGSTLCPADQFVVGIQGFKAGDAPDVRSPISELRYVCRTVDAVPTEGPVASDQTVPTSWEVRASPGSSPELAIELAKLSDPTYVKVTDANKSLRTVLADSCGEQPAEVQSLLEDLTKSLNFADDLDRPLDQNVTVFMPFCIPLLRNVPVAIAEGDTAFSLLRDQLGIYGPRTLERTFELNREAFDWTDRRQFEAELPIGGTLVLPYVAPPQIFTPRFDNIQFPAIVASIANFQAQSPESAPRPAFVEHPPGQVDLVESITTESTGASSCPAGEAIGNAVDFPGLNEVFDAEKAWLIAHGGAVNNVVVGIIDTGLRSPEDDFFIDDVLSINSLEANGGIGIDDNHGGGLGAIDDNFGINLSKGAPGGTVTPDFITTWSLHGTRMATLMLGGPTVATDWPAQSRPPLQLKVVNFTGESGGQLQKADVLGQAIVYLGDFNAKVVNMSLSFELDLDGVKNAMEKRDDTLFVVAAGNSETATNPDLGTTQRFPAAWGGKEGKRSDNVLTVGAHGRTGSVAPFSFISSGLVDFFAPGCGIPTRGLDGAPVIDDGTSPAAALVSFAAGLISTLDLAGGPSIQGARLKSRLLISVDFDPTLDRKAATSGRLNMVKALSLSRDVLQTTDGQLHFGEVDRTGLFAMCKQVMALDPRDVRKFVARAPSPEGPASEFWITPRDHLQRPFCVHKPDADVKISISGQSFPLSEIRDITFADRH